MADSSESPITAEQVVKDVMERHPETRKVFAEYDLDLCCGGVHPIGLAARAKGADLESLLSALNAAAGLSRRP